MNQDRIELIITESGGREAVRLLERLLQLKDTLHRQKIDIQIERARIERDIRALRAAMRELVEGKNTITVNVGGVDHVISSLEQAQELLEGLVERRHELRIRTGEANGELSRTRTEISDLKREIDAANEGFERMVQIVSRVGAAIQNLGSVSNFVGGFTEMIGDAFSKMSGIYRTNFFEYANMALADMATKAVFGNANKITSRYDIMSTFTDYMRLAGVMAEDAEKALDRVDQSIRGLPIGLDESAQRLRRYQMFLGDINRSTNLTIGLQKALYAGGANEQMRTTSLYEMERLLSVGSLSTTRQWNAMIQGLGVSVRFLAQELGADQQSLPALLSSGAISSEEFLRALERLGEGSSQAAKELDQALSIYKGTLESWISNIEFAAIRGGETILKSLNAALGAGTGRGIVGYMESFRDGMNEMYAAMGKWITANPGAFSGIVGSVERLIGALQGIGVGRIAEKVFENIARGFDMITQAIGRLPNRFLEDFIAFATTLAGPLGKLFQTVSAGAPIVLGIFDRFKNFDFEHLLDRIITQVERMATVVSGLLRLIPDGVMTELMAFGLVWGKPIAAVLTGIGDALVRLSVIMQGRIFASFIEHMGTLYSRMKINYEMFQMFEKAVPTWRSAFLSIGSAAATVAASVGGILAVFSAIANPQYEKFLDTSGLRDLRDMVDDAASTLDSTNALAEKQNRTLAESEVRLERAKTLTQEIRQLNRNVSDDTGFATLQAKISELTSLYPNLSIEVDEATRKITKNGMAALDTAEDYAKLAEAQAIVKSGQEMLAQLFSQKLQIQIDRKAIERAVKEARERVNELTSRQDWAEDAHIYAEVVERQNFIDTGAAQAMRDLDEAEKEYDNQIKDVNAAVEEQNRLLTENADVVDEMAQAHEQAADSMSGTAQQLESLRERYNDLKADADKAIDSVVHGFDRVEIAARQSLSKTRENIDSQYAAFKDYNDNMEKIIAYIVENNDTVTRNFRQTIADLASDPLGNAGIIAGFANAVDNPEEMAAVTASIEKMYEESVKTADLSTTAGLLVDGLTDKVLALMREKGLGLYEILNDPRWEKWFDTAGISESAGRHNENALEEKLMLVNEKSEETKKGAEELKDELIELRKQGLDPVEEGAEQASEKLDDTTKSVNDLSDATDAAIPIMDSFKDSIARLWEKAIEATEAVKALSEVISGLEDKDVNINVHTNTFNTPGWSTTAAAAERLGFATGGNVPGYGTRDTVPAMLTPGEYVLKRSAAKALGGTVLGRLNNLDFGGAIDAMMSGVSRPTLMHYNVTNTRNDNRQVNVTQNIQTNNPSYSYRVASRFAHAL